MIGFSTAPIGNGVLVGTDGQVVIATTAGGAYSAYGDPLPAGAKPSAIWWPRFKTSGADNSGSTPDYWLFSDTLTASNESLWYVSSAGTVFTSRTPLISADYGLAVSPDCLAIPFRIGTELAIVGLFDTEVHLMTSVNSGVAYTDRGQIDDAALYVRFRRGDVSLMQLLIANGITDFTVSPTLGANLIAKTSPTTSALIGGEFYG